MSHVVTVPELLDGHVVLDIECLDRVYLNGYVPSLQAGGQVVAFLHGHLGMKIASPGGVRADRHPVPAGGRPVRGEQRHTPGQVRQGHAEDRRDAPAAGPGGPGLGRSQVVAIGWAQEFQHVWEARKRTPSARRRSSPSPSPSGVSPATTSTCGMRISAARSSRSARISPTRLRSGSTATSGPSSAAGQGRDWVHRAVQRVRFLRRPRCPAGDPRPARTWHHHGVLRAVDMPRLPLPLTPADRAGGYWWELSMRQVEASRTLVLDAPRNARAFFRGAGRGQPGPGPPGERRADLRPGAEGPHRQAAEYTPAVCRTAIDRYPFLGPWTTAVTINAFYKKSRIKQYLKDGRALRIETVVNSPNDLGVARRLHNLDELQARARAANARLLHTERACEGCVFDSPAFARISQPSLPRTAGGPRTTVRRPSSPGPGLAPSPTRCAPSPASRTRACAP